MRHSPRLNATYWMTLIAGSIFGTNAGDFAADNLHLGHLQGLPFLLMIFGALLAAERALPQSGALLFWGAIITVRTAATNIGDSFRDFGIGFPVSVPLVLALFAAGVVWSRVSSAGKTADRPIEVNASYWACMTLAGVLGTLVGDVMSFVLGLGTLLAAACQGVVVAVVLAAGITRGLGGTVPSRSNVAVLPLYWTTVALIRCAGTSAGDWLSHEAFGLEWSTAITGLCFCVLVAHGYGRRVSQGDTGKLAAQASD